MFHDIGCSPRRRVIISYLGRSFQNQVVMEGAEMVIPKLKIQLLEYVGAETFLEKKEP
jgi:hypothetical protein